MRRRLGAPSRLLGTVVGISTGSSLVGSMPTHHCGTLRGMCYPPNQSHSFLPCPSSCGRSAAALTQCTKMTCETAEIGSRLGTALKFCSESEKSTAGGGGSGAAPATPTAYQCSNCLKTFRLFNALQHHIKTKHGGDAKPVAIGADGKPIEDAALPAAGGAKPSAPTPKATAAPSTPGASAAPSATPAASGGTTTVTDATTRPGAPPAEDTEAEKQKGFVCTICGKAFRLEAALQHHYMAKHNQQMPSATAAAASGATSGSTGEAPTTGATEGVAASTGTTTITDSLPNVAAGFQYVRSSEPVEPQPPQYHLEVAPNAPEESEVAAHAMCVNRMTLLGVVSDVTTGYVFEEPCISFTLATGFDKPHTGDPDEDFHTVRCLGQECCDRVRPFVSEGNRVMVVGRLRLVPQFEQLSNKYYHFPIVQVHNGASHVSLIQTAEELAQEQDVTVEEQPTNGAAGEGEAVAQSA